ncbi:STAS domain-containing protein [Streptomyces sp. NPDC005899]|uniref:STAS domain-containing protein n=1 Tax=Streptomyces sp. NPDC005899 TaxID=3155716 RepID=UPI0033D6C5A9
MTVYPFTSQAAVHSGVARVTLAGELDLDTAPYVHDAVTACLAEGPTRLRLDLSDLTFCDCAGLSALLRVRATILGAGVDLVVEGVGAQLARLLSLIGADDVFARGSTLGHAEPAHRAPGRGAALRGRAAVTADSAHPDVLA